MSPTAPPELNPALKPVIQPGAPPVQTVSAKRSAALFSVIAASVVTSLKLVAALLSGSLGMFSETAHSGVDLVASAITLYSVRAADRPADEDHNYGHGKIESLSAFVETGIMLASCVWLFVEAVRRIVFHQHLQLTLSIWPFAVLLLSIAVDFTRSRTLARVAHAESSDALAADSVHFATDMWASFAVLVGLIATYTGRRYNLPVLEYADPIAAIAVAGVILNVSWHLAHQTIDTLLDAAPAVPSNTSHAADTRSLLESELIAIPGVLSVERLRTRRSGPSYFADITLGMPRNLTFQRSEQITLAATEAVRRHLPGADVVVHSVPTASLAESVHDRIRAVAALRNLTVHEISVQQYGTQAHPQLHIELHLEVNETLPLLEAHSLATELESGIRHDIPEIVSILTHIESETSTIERPSSLVRDQNLEARLRQAAHAFPEIIDIHDVFVTRTPRTLLFSPSTDNLQPGSPASSLAGVEQATGNSHEHTQVSCHATLPDTLPMSRVHAVITALEGAYKLIAPEVDRLLIHPEPATDNRR